MHVCVSVFVFVYALDMEVVNECVCSSICIEKNENC